MVGGGGRGAKAKVHSTFWVVGGVGGVGGVGWVVVVVVGGRRQRCMYLLGGRWGRRDGLGGGGGGGGRGAKAKVHSTFWVVGGVGWVVVVVVVVGGRRQRCIEPSGW